MSISDPPDVEAVGTMTADAAAAALLDPTAYADGRLERAADLLRHTSPVHWTEHDEFDPFFALLRHEDIHDVERRGDLFRAGGRSLVSMDPPEHTQYRAITADWFHPRSLRTLEDRVRALARASVDSMAERGGTYDFVTEISMYYPLTVICTMLGVPEEDRLPILKMTQQAFGAEDPEYRAAAQPFDPAKDGMAFGGYFFDVIEDRRLHPTDDISTVLANATIDGEPLPPMDLMGYFGILATAGHDTTSSTIAGGLRALVEHPDQLARLRDDPELVTPAVEEMIRWVTPVKSFMRVAMDDTEIRGERIAAGQAVLLLYASANRDEEVFGDPARFDVGRDPNRHLAFGHGAHFCLGAQLARLETRAFFAELVPRLRSIELAGEPELVKTLFVGGLKHLPIRAEVV